MRHKPYSTGVQHLMYVGDEEPAPATTAAPATGLARLSPTEKVAGGLGVFLALTSKGLMRLAGAAAAGYLGYKAFK